MTDWRAKNADSIRGESLCFRNYAQPSETWDHEHCMSCWDKFTETGTDESLTEGYVTCNDDWICPTCFRDLSATMGWKLVTETDPLP